MRTDDDVVDMIDIGEFQDRRRRIDRLEHVHREPALVELQRRSPVPERDHPVDMLVVALLVERAIDGDAAELQDVDTGEPRGRQRRENPLGGYAQRGIEAVRPLRGIERDRDDRARGQLRRKV